VQVFRIALLCLLSCGSPPARSGGEQAPPVGVHTIDPSPQVVDAEKRRAFEEEVAAACGGALATAPPSARAWALRRPEHHDPSALSPREMDDLERLLAATPRSSADRPSILARLADDYATFEVAAHRECLANTLPPDASARDVDDHRVLLARDADAIRALGAAALRTCETLRRDHPEALPRTSCSTYGRR
jgi:hypothetical protein